MTAADCIIHATAYAEACTHLREQLDKAQAAGAPVYAAMLAQQAALLALSKAWNQMTEHPLIGK